MTEPAWVEPFLANLRRTGRSGRVNVTIAAVRANVCRELVYYYRRLPGYERLRQEWDQAARAARESKRTN